jgi:hypothetical protein
MLTSLAFALTLASPAIDFDHHPAPVPVIVEALAKKLGRALVADEDLAVDILIIHLDQADPDKALEWIAEAIEAEWKQDGDKLRLTRSHETEQRQEREERSEVLNQIKASLESIPLAEPLDKATAGLVAELIKTALSQPAAQMNLPSDLNPRLPAYRFALRVAKAIDYSQFLDLPQGAEVYIPFDAHSVDARLPRELTRFLADFEREDEAFAEAIRQRGIDFSEYLYYGPMQPGNWSKGPAKCAVKISNEGMLDVRVVVSWGAGYVGEYTPYAQNRPRSAPLVTHKEWEFTPKPASLAVDFWTLKAPRDFVSKDMAAKVPANLTKYFLEDPSFDLFGLGSSDLVVECARTLGKSIVALLPDSMAYAPNRLVARPNLSLQEMSYYLFLPGYVELVERPDVMIARPKMPSSTRKERLPREALRGIIRDAQRGRSDIDVYADLIAKSDGKSYIGDPRQLLSRASRMVHLTEGYMDSQLALRAYGLLSDSQRRDARAREVALPLRTLNRDEQATWAAIVRSNAKFGYPGPIDPETSLNGEAVESPTIELRSLLLSGAMPSALVVRVVESTILVGGDTTEGQSPWFQFIEGASFESMMAHKELGREGWPFDKFSLVPGVRIKVWTQIGGVRHLIADYLESSSPEVHPCFEFEKIPRELVDAHRAGIDRIKEELRNIPPD